MTLVVIFNPREQTLQSVQQKAKRDERIIKRYLAQTASYIVLTKLS